MSKVLLINGSPRKDGNTFHALDKVARTLNDNGIDTEIAWIGVKPVRGCISCGMCHQNGNGKCAFDDDICNTMIEKMNSADALVVGSPVYYGQPAGQLLALMQRMFYAGAQVDNKPAAAVAVCRRGGATAALQTLMMPFQLKNMPLVTSQYWNIVYGMNKGEAKLDVEGMQTMRQLARNMVRQLNNNAPIPVEEDWQPMHFIR